MTKKSNISSLMGSMQKAKTQTQDRFETADIALGTKTQEPEKPKAPVENAAPEPLPPKRKYPSEKTSAPLIRTSLAIPEGDARFIDQLSETFLKQGMRVNQTEIFRTGLLALRELSTTDRKKLILQLERLPTGRPKKKR